jgi:predicted acyltransferase
MNNTSLSGQDQGRMFSIDFFRGFTMFMLIGEFSGFFGTLVNPVFDGTFISAIGRQLEHADWIGLHFWDLIQPFFMFIVGVAMPFSMTRRWNRGDSWNTTLRHAATRSALLLFLGWALYCIGPGKITFRFTNVLAQLSVTYFIAFLIMRKAVKWQILVSFLLILLSDLLYQFWSVEGFNQPFTPDHNFGSWFDLALTGTPGGGHWVAFNAIPTTAHTIWGVIAGMILMNDWTPRKKIQTMLVAGMIGLIVGYALHAVIPMIKHICTSSFVIASGGWSLIALAISYWLIDVMNFKRFTLFFAIVGMNPLFIYLFAHTNGNGWIEAIVKPFINVIFGGFGELVNHMALTAAIWAGLWGICYFLYKRKVFIKL